MRTSCSTSRANAVFERKNSIAGRRPVQNTVRCQRLFTLLRVFKCFEPIDTNNNNISSRETSLNETNEKDIHIRSPCAKRSSPRLYQEPLRSTTPQASAASSRQPTESIPVDTGRRRNKEEMLVSWGSATHLSRRGYQTRPYGREEQPYSSRP